ncbi:MAG TPA: hypothetical protein DCS43_00685 [Verrucomicrobia bacterium]|nr:hypothetical protein [Verrucomicrobiota bacterium]
MAQAPTAPRATAPSRPAASWPTSTATPPKPFSCIFWLECECVGDDIAWMKIRPDGRLHAINPESGFFRKSPEGKWLWPGFGENIRVMKWMCERVEGKVGPVDPEVLHDAGRDGQGTDRHDRGHEQGKRNPAAPLADIRGG